MQIIDFRMHTHLFFVFEDNIDVTRGVETGAIVQFVDLNQLFLDVMSLGSVLGNVSVTVHERLVAHNGGGIILRGVISETKDFALEKLDRLLVAHSLVFAIQVFLDGIVGVGDWMLQGWHGGVSCCS